MENQEDGINGGKAGFRASSTRWTPTSEQIRILKELYYNNGVRSPSAEQIQRISARLRQFGKIEGKNVFYWFQNHKARERQKKRFTSDPPNHPPPTIPAAAFNYHHNPNTLSHGVPSPSSSSSSHGMHTMGHITTYGYGSIAMENSFRECSISPKNESRKGGKIGQNLGWMGIDTRSPTIPYPFLDQNIKPNDNKTQNHVEEEEESHKIETLPLFPMHGEEIKVYGSNRNYSYTSASNGWIDSRASLELSLNSYASGWSMN